MLHGRASGKPLKRLGGGAGFAATALTLEEGGLATVCREASCPNRSECWGEGTATFLLLGKVCTRGCRFCAVATGERPPPPDPGEPARIVEAARRMKLNYVVLTSVTRDDLPGGGAEVFAETTRLLKISLSGVKVEILTPDYRGDALAAALEGGPEVFAHNVETVERLTPSVRHPAFSWRGSLETLSEAARLRPGIVTKSSLLLGLGETKDEVVSALCALREAGVSLLALGQYLSPGGTRVEVARYLSPAEFDDYAELARSLGFAHVASGASVRTSYKAFASWLEATR